MTATRRALCTRCTRPATACICRWITPLASAVELLILQHPMEVSNAKGSARLLQLSVAHAVMAVGEQFSETQLHDLLFADDRVPILLYPNLPGERELGLAEPPALDPALLSDPARLRLVILDGTWRKSRKMLYQNRLLQQLPRLALTDVRESHYRIRKAHAPDQLSTLEASCLALAQLHGDAGMVLPLLGSFDAFVTHFQATTGKLASSTSTHAGDE